MIYMWTLVMMAGAAVLYLGTQIPATKNISVQLNPLSVIGGLLVLFALGGVIAINLTTSRT